MPQEVITFMTINALILTTLQCFQINFFKWKSSIWNVSFFFTFYLCKCYILSPILILQKCLFFSLCGGMGVSGGQARLYLCHSVYVEVRGQLWGVHSLFASWDLGIEFRWLSLCSKFLYPLNHLSGLIIYSNCVSYGGLMGHYVFLSAFKKRRNLRKNGARIGSTNQRAESHSGGVGNF